MPRRWAVLECWLTATPVLRLVDLPEWRTDPVPLQPTLVMMAEVLFVLFAGLLVPAAAIAKLASP